MFHNRKSIGKSWIDLGETRKKNPLEVVWSETVSFRETVIRSYMKPAKCTFTRMTTFLTINYGIWQTMACWKWKEYGHPPTSRTFRKTVFKCRYISSRYILPIFVAIEWISHSGFPNWLASVKHPLNCTHQQQQPQQCGNLHIFFVTIVHYFVCVSKAFFKTREKKTHLTEKQTKVKDEISPIFCETVCVFFRLSFFSLLLFTCCAVLRCFFFFIYFISRLFSFHIIPFIKWLMLKSCIFKFQFQFIHGNGWKYVENRLKRLKI